LLGLLDKKLDTFFALGMVLDREIILVLGWNLGQFSCFYGLLWLGMVSFDLGGLLIIVAITITHLFTIYLSDISYID